MRETWVEVAHARLYVADDGDGAALLLLHGGMADHRAAWPVVAPLAGRFRVIAPDLRGSGRSHYGMPISFDQLADDLASVLDRLGVRRAIVGGISGGSGVAVRFALRYPARVLGLVLVRPMYAGADRGYTAQQSASFAAMDAVASRAVAEGVRVMHPLYAALPPGIREQALAMLDEFDPASVVATSRFIASGSNRLQPPRCSARSGCRCCWCGVTIRRTLVGCRTFMLPASRIARRCRRRRATPRGRSVSSASDASEIRRPR